MSQRGEDLGLAQHAIARTRIGLGVASLHLQCDHSLAERVARTVNPAHSAAADGALDTICADDVPRPVFAIHELGKAMFMRCAIVR